MQVKQGATTVDVRPDSFYGGYYGLEITDLDGTEVKVRMNSEQWLKLEETVKNKCDSIRSKRDDEINEIVERRVAEALANQS